MLRVECSEKEKLVLFLRKKFVPDWNDVCTKVAQKKLRWKTSLGPFHNLKKIDSTHHKVEMNITPYSSDQIYLITNVRKV